MIVFLVLIVDGSIFRGQPMGNRLGLDRRKDDMVTVGDNNRTGTPTISGVDEHPFVPALLNDPFDGR